MTLRDYLRTRIVCEKCGLDQEFREPRGEDVIPCEGAIGLHCDGEVAVGLDTFPMLVPETGIYLIIDERRVVMADEESYDCRRPRAPEEGVWICREARRDRVDCLGRC